MQREKIPEHLRKLAKEYASQKSKGQEETNAANRKKTEFRNALVKYWTENELPIGSFIRLGGIEYTYEAATTKSLDTEAILTMYDNGEISRETFLKIIKIDTRAASTALGGDMVADLTITSIGDKVDIRTNDLPVEQAEEEYIGVRRQVRKKIKRSKFGRDAAARASGTVKDRSKVRTPRIRTRK